MPPASAETVPAAGVVRPRRRGLDALLLIRHFELALLDLFARGS